MSVLLRTLLLITVVLFVNTTLCAADSATLAQLDFFEQRIRPVLIEHCYRCHSGEGKGVKGGLRLDTRALLRQGGDSGPAIVPGDPTASLLIQALKHDGLEMPPERKLSPQVIADFERWVRDGAADPRVGTASTPTAAAASPAAHWAFQPLGSPAIPKVQDTAWPRTSIDYFILAQLEQHALRPAAAADPRTLLRRVYFDLIGLPPKAEDVEAFVQACHAEEQKRKADSRTPADTASALGAPLSALSAVVDRLLASPQYGERWARHWLDVARYADTKGYAIFGKSEFPWAFTYRDYVVSALNDDLPYDQFIIEQLAADLLPRRRNDRALAALGFLTVGPRFIDNMHDIIDDRIDVVTRGLMGLSVGCARCHDHKYDPIPTRDYYSLYGVFASCIEPLVPPLIDAPPQTDGYRKYDEELQKRVTALQAFLDEKYAALLSSSRRRVGDYLLAVEQRRGRPRQDDFMLLADTADLNPAMIGRWQNYLQRARQTRHPVFVAWHALVDLPSDTFAEKAPQTLAELAKVDAAKPINARVLSALLNPPVKSLGEAAVAYGKLLVEIDDRWQEFHRARPDAQRLPEAADEALRGVLYAADSVSHFPRSAYGDLDLLPDRATQGKWRELLKAIEDHRAAGPDAPPRAMVLVDLPKPNDPQVFIRGNPGQRGDRVPRQFLELLDGPTRAPFGAGSGRLELARKIADPRNPLTPRVLVNRLWMHHFGMGIVRTPSDFGVRSEPPTHGALLDHLSRRFIDGGWSLKQLHRELVLSATYAQVSDLPNDNRIDPDNRLWSRMNRRRLEWEPFHDALLAVAAQLDPTLGGPTVSNTLSEGSNRRALYGYLDRYTMPTTLRTFDFPNPDSSNPQRDVTTVTPQALFMMNHPLVMATARRVALMSRLPSTEQLADRVAWIYRRVYSRSPTADEQRLAQEFLGSASSPSAWEQFAHALLMSNEFMFVD